MKVLVAEHWERFVADAVEQGRFGSASDVVNEGLRLLEEREAKLASLRRTVDAAIAGGGRHTGSDVVAAVKARLDALSRHDPTK